MSVTPSPCWATCSPRAEPARTGAVSTKRAAPDSSTYDACLPVAGLRPGVSGQPHAKDAGVEVRRLPGVANREHHRVDRLDREGLDREGFDREGLDRDREGVDNRRGRR